MAKEKETSASNESQGEKAYPLKDFPESIRQALNEAPGERQLLRVVSEQRIAQFRHQGPLPHSSEARAYEDIQPGTLNRLLSMEERKLELTQYNLQTQRFIWEKNAHLAEVDLQIFASNERRGQWMALPVALSILSLIGIAIFTHPDWKIIDALAAIFTVGGLGTLFLNRQQAKEPQERKKPFDTEEKSPSP